jgi:hypothetical protein
MLYYLTNGTILWSETTESETGFYDFDAKHTLVVTPTQRQDSHSVDLAANKLSDGMFKCSSATVPLSSIVMKTDCTDEAMTTKFRAALAGIIIPGKN